jgi:hypothetical protein
MTQEQEINVLQISNNLVASAMKNMTNLAGMIEQLSNGNPEQPQINNIANVTVANAAKQIGSLGNLIEQMAMQMNQFVEHNAQGVTHANGVRA